MEKEPTLGLVMIVKNEEKGIEHCIQSAYEHVDYIKICVDDKSTDGTLEIAKRYADEVQEFTFDDDFAAARNKADEGVPTEWRLFLDGHEYIKKFEGVRELLKSEHDGLMCAVEMDNGMVFNNPRLYRKGVQFAGRVHEKQECKNVGNAPGVEIVHDRFGRQSETAAAERAAQRDDMVPRIMGEEVRKNKKNLRAIFHLGLWAWSKKRYREAMMWGKKYLRYSQIPGVRWFVLFNMAQGQLEQGHFFRAYWYAKRAENETPERWEIEKLKGMILFGAKKYAAAVECFVTSFNKNTKPVFFMPWKRDDAGTWNIIGECFFQMNAYDKASLAFGEAAKQSSDKKMAVFFAARAALLGAASRDAFSRFEELTKKDEKSMIKKGQE